MNELANTLRMYAEDIHSAVGCSDCSTAMSQAADRLEELDDCDTTCREVYKSLDGVPYKGSYANGVEFLKARIAELEKERDSLVSALDTAMVVTCLGTYSSGQDPRNALDKLMAWSESVGAYFAQDRLEELEKANAIEKANGNHWSDAYTKWATTDLAAIRLKELEQKNSELEKENAELESEIRTLTRQNGEWREDRDQLAAHNVALQQALEGLAYYVQPYKKAPPELVGFEVKQGDKSFAEAEAALNLPNLDSEVLNRRDAELLRLSVDRLEVMEREHANFFDRWHGERRRREKLVDDVERCYRMLLSEPNTKGALFKAENILREALADAKSATHNAKITGG